MLNVEQRYPQIPPQPIREGVSPYGNALVSQTVWPLPGMTLRDYVRFRNAYFIGAGYYRYGNFDPDLSKLDSMHDAAHIMVSFAGDARSDHDDNIEDFLQKTPAQRREMNSTSSVGRIVNRLSKYDGFHAKSVPFVFRDSPANVTFPLLTKIYERLEATYLQDNSGYLEPESRPRELYNIVKRVYPELEQCVLFTNEVQTRSIDYYNALQTVIETIENTVSFSIRLGSNQKLDVNDDDTFLDSQEMFEELHTTARNIRTSPHRYEAHSKYSVVEAVEKVHRHAAAVLRFLHGHPPAMIATLLFTDEKTVIEWLRPLESRAPRALRDLLN